MGQYRQYSGTGDSTDNIQVQETVQTTSGTADSTGNSTDKIQVQETVNTRYRYRRQYRHDPGPGDSTENSMQAGLRYRRHYRG